MIVVSVFVITMVVIIAFDMVLNTYMARTYDCMKLEYHKTLEEMRTRYQESLSTVIDNYTDSLADMSKQYVDNLASLIKAREEEDERTN